MIPFRDNVPSRRYPIITVSLIVTNIAVFVYQLSLPPEMMERFFFQYGVVPAKLHSIFQAPSVVLTGLGTSFFSSMFLHGGLIHLIGNMWYLWIFGDNVEDRMGPVRFCIFYLLCGVLAGLAHIIFNFNSPLPSIGASGAVAGVLGAYLVSFPFARVLTLVPFFFFFPIVELPAILVLGFWFFVQLFNGTAAMSAASSALGGVAWWAHIGGFLAGMVLVGSFAQRPVRRYYWE